MSGTPEEENLSCEAALAIDFDRQLLRRSYSWHQTGEEVTCNEVIHHRLLFPVELKEHLEVVGFSVEWMGGTTNPLDPGELDGPRLIVLARLLTAELTTACL